MYSKGLIVVKGRLGVLVVLAALLLFGCADETVPTTAQLGSATTQPAVSTTAVPDAPATTIAESEPTTSGPTSTMLAPRLLTGELRLEVANAIEEKEAGCDSVGEWREWVYVGQAVLVYSTDGALLGEGQLGQGILEVGPECRFLFAIEVPPDSETYDICFDGYGPNGPIYNDEMTTTFNWHVESIISYDEQLPTEARPCSLFWG